MCGSEANEKSYAISHIHKFEEIADESGADHTLGDVD